MVKEKEFTFGTCEYERTSPQKNNLSSETSVLNIILPFEEALKLNLAIDECVRKLNKYKKSTTGGKRAALNLTVHFHLNRIAVNEGKLKRSSIDLCLFALKIHSCVVHSVYICY